MGDASLDEEEDVTSFALGLSKDGAQISIGWRPEDEEELI